MKYIPPHLDGKLKQRHQTIGNNANPQMRVLVSRAKSSIQDSSYFTVEDIRTKTGLSDIGVATRRQKSYGAPDGLFAIHLDNGIANILERDYPDKLELGWRSRFSVGAAKAVATCFDGHWQRRRDLWNLVTDEYPYIFWVTNSGVLKSQLWNDVSTTKELATNVVKVSVMRGWKNTIIPTADHGIVALYIKNNGRVYYRNYAIQQDGSTTWDLEQEVTEFTGTARNVNLFLTNDYRIGITIENTSGSIVWLITPRNWGGMASPMDYLTAGLSDIQFDVGEIKEWSVRNTDNISAGLTDVWINQATPIYPELLSVENPDGSEYHILLKFNHAIHQDVTNSISSFVVKDTQGTIFSINSVRIGSDRSELILNMTNFASANGDMTITYDRALFTLDSENEGSLFAIDSFNFVFTPDLTPPEAYVDGRIDVSIHPTFNVIDVNHRDTSNFETINAGISDIKIVVTKINEQPL